MAIAKRENARRRVVELWLHDVTHGHLEQPELYQLYMLRASSLSAEESMRGLTSAEKKCIYCSILERRKRAEK